jgi:type IV fimbrial biogenesis protein FimT
MKQQGFSLIELLITTSIITIISQTAGYGIDTTRYWLEPKRLFSAIQEIRTIAVTNNQHGVLCPSSDSYKCLKNWTLPLIMFIDENNNKQRDINETIIQTITPFTGIERTIIYPRNQINFNGQGHINGYTGTLKYCSKYNTKGIVLSRVGRTRYLLNSNPRDPIICNN